MSMVKSSHLRTAALTAVISAAAFGSPAFAAPTDPTAPSGPPTSSVNLDANGHVVNTTQDTSMQGGAMVMPNPAAQAPVHHHPSMTPATTDQTAPAAPGHKNHMAGKEHSPEEMRMHVEERIKSLHAKLMITKEQEAQWNDVAQAMRDSEANVSSLIRERHENGGTMNAVDDLESYQAIAEAHAEGLKKVNAAFKTLYGNMSEEQQKNADQVFGGYEGHGQHPHHGHKPQPKPQQ